MTKKVPQTPQPQTPDEPQERDNCLTPDYATDLIVPFLNPNWVIWENCAGVEPRKMVRRLEHHGFKVHGTSIEDGEEWNCLTAAPKFHWDAIVTNVPFSIAEKCIARFIELDKPFATLLPANWTSWKIDACKNAGCIMLIPNRRINYVMPNILRSISDSETWKAVKAAFRQYADDKPLAGLISKPYNKVKDDAWVIAHMAQYRTAQYATLDECPKELLAAYSSSQFHSCWFTRGLKANHPGYVEFVDLPRDQLTNV